nr:hepatocyte growth factor-regulated tyrosine kinase substrate [Ipomoea batatas]
MSRYCFGGLSTCAAEEVFLIKSGTFWCKGKSRWHRGHFVKINFTQCYLLQAFKPYGVVGELCVLNTHQIKWPYHSLLFIRPSEFAPNVLMMPLECKCGMPLCICETEVETAPQGTATSSTVTVQTNPKPKKVNTAPKSSGSASNNKQGTVFNLGQVTSTSSGPTSGDYEVNGEGMREAIKNGDTAAAKRLLSQAAVFNQTEIAFALMESGASLNYKNPQGETPLDCAPATLQYKMKKEDGRDSAVWLRIVCVI